MTWVKVCGITSLDDALLAVEAGADALGFVFAASPRQVGPEQAAAIIRHLPKGIQTVGVFVDALEAEIARIVEDCDLTLVQLHGQEPPELCARLSVPALKAFRLRGPETLGEMSPYQGRVRALLLDAYRAGQAGGTGHAIDLSLALEAKQYGDVIVAGGLSGANVAEAIRRVQPFGVDASSRLEAAPGRKDARLVREFIAAVRRTDAT